MKSLRICRPFFIENILMSERLLRGEPVSEEQIQAWADEAEAGYDLSKLPPTDAHIFPHTNDVPTKQGTG